MLLAVLNSLQLYSRVRSVQNVEQTLKAINTFSQTPQNHNSITRSYWSYYRIHHGFTINPKGFRGGWFAQLIWYIFDVTVEIWYNRWYSKIRLVFTGMIKYSSVLEFYNFGYRFECYCDILQNMASWFRYFLKLNETTFQNECRDNYTGRKQFMEPGLKKQPTLIASSLWYIPMGTNCASLLTDLFLYLYI